MTKMGRLVTGIAVWLLHNVIVIHALTKYCKLTVDSGGLHGSCISLAVHHTHRIPSCSHTALRIGNSCYCSNQACVDTIESSYNAAQTKSHLNCHSHRCDAREICALAVNSRGIHGSCISQTALSHYPACTDTGPRTNHPCTCGTQTCIDDAIHTYKTGKTSVGYNCHGHMCTGADVCLLSSLSSFNSRCDAKHHKPECSSHSYTKGETCYCDSQHCIDSFLLGANKADSHVHCGHICHVHDHQVCVLSNRGTLGTNVHSHVQLSCVSQDTITPSLCTSFPQAGESCSCVNQVCIERFYNACQDAKNIADCERYEEGYHVCESTNPVLAEIAANRCAQYCNLCVANMATTTTVTTTQTTTTTTMASTTPKIYPSCVGRMCSRYAPYCHLYEYNTYVEGRCMPFQVGPNCHNYTELRGSGCTCSNTPCSINVLWQHSLKVTHPTTNTPAATHESTTIISTQEASTAPPGYDCFGQLCTPDKNYCHMFEYMDSLDARCMPFTAWPDCKAHTDLKQSGCTCTSRSCAISIVHSYMSNITLPTTTSTPGLDCFKVRCAANQVCRISLVTGNIYSGYCVPKVSANTSFCNGTKITDSTECDCITQNCVNSFKSNPPTNMAMSSTSVTTESTKLPTTTQGMVHTTEQPSTPSIRLTTAPTTEGTSTPYIRLTTAPTTEGTSTPSIRLTTAPTTATSSTPTIKLTPAPTTEGTSTPSIRLTTAHTKVESSTPSIKLSTAHGTAKPTTITTRLTPVPTTMATSTPSSLLTTAHVTEEPSTVTTRFTTTHVTEEPSTITTRFTTTPIVTTSMRASTESSSVSTGTTKEVCEDKPGIDCKLLNSTNICANPFSHQYCAAFCGHCTATIDTVFG